MKDLCLPRNKANKMRDALRDNDITIDSLYKMSSSDRQTIFSQYVGPEFAPTMNARFERAMLSKQKKAIANWVKQSTNPKLPVRRDMMKRVENLNKVLEDTGVDTPFLEDLTEMKLGVRVSEEEASSLLNMAKNINDAKARIPASYMQLSEAPRNMADIPKEVMEFAVAQDSFTNYTRALITDAEQVTLEQYAKYQQFDAVMDLANAMKSSAASFDVSFMGRQGINLLAKGHFRIWARGMQQNLKAFSKTLMEENPGLFQERNDAMMRAVMVDIYSQPNFINGKFLAAREGYGLGVSKEEAFPSSLPQRVPVFGRVFHASENAFNTTALTLRKELANFHIKMAEQQGIDMTDPINANALSNYITTSTGRGPIGKAGVFGKELNALFFSVRFWTAQFNLLTGHALDSTIRKSPEIRRLAAKETLKMYRNLAAMYAVVYGINSDAVSWIDEGGMTSRNFGRIKVSENNEFDPTGGMLTHARVAMQLATGWSYDPKRMKWIDHDEDAFGALTRADVLNSYITGKASPAASIMRDWLRGRTFDGGDFKFVDATIGAIVPITTELVEDEMKSGRSDALMAVVMEALGVSPYTTNFYGNTTKWRKVKEQTDPETFSNHLIEVTDNYRARAEDVRNSYNWTTLDNSERNDLLDSIRREESEKVFSQYNMETEE